MSRIPKVLLLLHDFSNSGAPRMALGILKELKGEVDALVVSPESGPLQAAFEQLAPTISLTQTRVPLSQLLLRMDKRIVGTRGLLMLAGSFSLRHSRSWRPDVIYINSGAALVLARYVGLRDVPVLLHVHETGTTIAHHRRIFGELYDKRPSHYITVSQHARASLVSQGIESSRISVVPNFLNLATVDELQVLAAKHPKPTSTPSFVVGGAGTISWCKGPELWLLTAHHLLSLLGPQKVRFCWVGVGEREDDAQFEVMAEKLGLRDSLTLVPSTQDPFSHYATFDALAFTSWEDSFGLVVLENMALGNIVACFAGGGGAPEVVGDAGLVIPHFDPYEMAIQLAEALQHKNNLTERAIIRANQFSAHGGAQSINRQILALLSGASSKTV